MLVDGGNVMHWEQDTPHPGSLRSPTLPVEGRVGGVSVAW